MVARATAHPIDLDDSVARLVESHKARTEEPLHLAVLFSPPRPGKHLHLLEVLSGFGGGRISREKRLFQMAFGSTPDFPLPPKVELHLTLTSPQELEAALKAEWASLKPIVESKRERTAKVLWADARGKRLWKSL